MEKRTFLKLCAAAAAMSVMPGIRLIAKKMPRGVLRAAKPQSYPGGIKTLNFTKSGKRGDFQG